MTSPGCALEQWSSLLVGSEWIALSAALRSDLIVNTLQETRFLHSFYRPSARGSAARAGPSGGR
jgi:hypothetical protein